MNIPTPDPTVQERLETAHNIWFGSVRPDGRPHLAPVWFAWHGGRLYVCIEAGSVKGRNVARDPRVALALEDGRHPVICEATAAACPAPWPEPVIGIFKQKYDWDISTDGQYNLLLEIMPEKWLSW